MGKLEAHSKQRRRRGYVQQAILSTIAISGVVTVALIAPNVLQVLGGRHKTSRFTYQTKTSLSRLAEQGYITFEQRNGTSYARITQKGKRHLMLASISHPKQPRRWDKRWRVLIFDVPEHRKAVREKLRRMVRAYGFVRLQDSVWVYPHDCEDLVALMKAELRIGGDVLYLIVEQLERDDALRKKFNLPKRRA